MKILIISQKFPPTIGGGETIAYNQAKYLARLNNDVTVLTENSPYSLIADGFNVMRSESISQIASGIFNLNGNISELYGIIKDNSFDVIHIHNYLVFIASLLVVRQSNAKIVFTQHCTPIENKKVIGFLGSYEYEHSLARFCFNNHNFDKIVAISNVYKNWALSNGVLNDKIFLNYPGVDLEHFRYDDIDNGLREELCFSHDDFVVFSPIRFLYRKGILDIVECFGKIRDSHVKLIIAGTEAKTDKDMLLLVKERIKKYGLGHRVTILEKGVSYFDMPRYYLMADLVCLPSHVEGLGISILEAMAMKKIVLATNIKGITEIVSHKENGFLVPPLDPDSLAKTVCEIRMLDHGYKNELTENGYEMVCNKFDCKKQIKELMKMYEEMYGN